MQYNMTQILERRLFFRCRCIPELKNLYIVNIFTPFGDLIWANKILCFLQYLIDTTSILLVYKMQIA